MKTKRLNIIIPEEDHRKAKSLLAATGKTMSEWVREELKKLLNNK